MQPSIKDDPGRLARLDPGQVESILVKGSSPSSPENAHSPGALSAKLTSSRDEADNAWWLLMHEALSVRCGATKHAAASAAT